VSLSLIAGCKRAGPADAGAPETAAAPPDKAAAAPPGPGPGMGLTGMLSEEEFKALHTLRKGPTPPGRGQKIEVGGAKGYLSLPPGGKPPFPALVVIHEWWGLNDNILHWTDRLAADGYAALAVDLYGGKVATTPDEAMKAMKSVDEKQAVATLLAAHRFLAADPRIAARRRGSIGWCFGGGYSLQLALRAPDLDAAVIYYGRLVTDVDKLKNIHAALLGIFGNRDKGIPPSAVDAFQTSLQKAGVQHEIHRYDADHAFANPSGGRYDEKSASAAWEKVRAFLSARLKGGK
jgi:carboxymethylenebutenolidase